MTESTPRTAAAIALTTRWLIAIAAVGLIASAFACAAKTEPAKTEPAGGPAKTVKPTGEEPPIRVRNGSMKLELDSGEWRDDADGWSPSTGKNAGGFTVKVESANGHTCGAGGQIARGNEVRVWYNSKPVVSFRFAGASGKTKVQPRDSLARTSPQLLRYGKIGDSGVITGVEVKDGADTWSCTFKSGDALSVISVCPAPNRACDK
jgi:hypothetical protein